MGIRKLYNVCADLAAECVNLIRADVASWLTHGVNTAWLVGEAQQDNSVTAI